MSKTFQLFSLHGIQITFICFLHSSIASTNSISANIGSFGNFTRELLPKPSKSKAYTGRDFAILSKFIAHSPTPAPIPWIMTRGALFAFLFITIVLMFLDPFPIVTKVASMFCQRSAKWNRDKYKIWRSFKGSLHKFWFFLLHLFQVNDTAVLGKIKYERVIDETKYGKHFCQWNLTHWWYLLTAIFNSASALSSSFYHCNLWMIKRKRNRKLLSTSIITVKVI